jgi:tetratricopeptide (TPR) repeat protein
MIQGQFQRAAHEYSTVDTAYQPEALYTQGRSVLLFYQGLACLWQGLPDQALSLARKIETLVLSNHYKHEGIVAKWLVALSLVALAAQMDSVERQQLLLEAETDLTFALTTCRRVNMVEYEPDILLTSAKWHYLKGNVAQAHADAQEAFVIADRFEYRLKQADIHNFLAQLALDEGNRTEARRHAEIAKERAWCNSPPHCYKPALDEAERLLKEISAG